MNKFEINSGWCLLGAWASIVGYALIKNAPFTDFCIYILILFSAHTGKRLWKSLKGVPQVGDPCPPAGPDSSIPPQTGSEN